MPRLRLLSAAAVLLGLLPGCSFFGYHRYQRAPRGTPEEAERIRFPPSYAEGIHLRGPELAAFLVAANEFIPPHGKADTHDKALTECLTRRDTYDATVLKANDDLYFVSFLPIVERCGIQPESPLIDAGATFAIDRRGRVLNVL